MTITGTSQPAGRRARPTAARSTRPPASIARQVLLRAPGPVLVGHFDAATSEQLARSTRRAAAAAASRWRRGAEEHAPALAGLVFVDRGRLEVVEQRVEAFAKDGVGRALAANWISSAGYSAKDVLHLFEERLLRRRPRRPARASPAAASWPAPRAGASVPWSASSGRRRERSRRDRRARGPTTSGMPLPRSLKRAPGCVPSGTLTSSSSVERRHADLAAERERREVDRHLAVEVVAVALEERVLLHVDDDVEVAGRAAGRAVLAFALEPQPLAGGDAGGNLDRDLALAADASRAAARLARLADRPGRCRGSAGRCARR